MAPIGAIFFAMLNTPLVTGWYLAKVGHLNKLIASTFGESLDHLSDASPYHILDETSPPFLVLSAERDIPGLSWEAKRFATALKKVSRQQVYFQIVPKVNHSSILDLAQPDNFARSVILDFVGVQKIKSPFDQVVEIERTWFDPPYSTEPFWQNRLAISTYPMDEVVRDVLGRVINQNTYQLSPLSLKHYHAIPLNKLSLLLGKKGRYLITTNIRQQKYYWPVEEMLPYDPVIVVGLDDEKNLFRYGVSYQAKQAYSWGDTERPARMFRPLGGFLIFRKPPPEHFKIRFFADISLTLDGLEFVDRNPLDGLGVYPEELQPVMTYRNGCVSCHRFRKVGSRAHHNRASDGLADGGYALDLEAYPPAVWKRFVFQQAEVAGEMGAFPNLVEERLQRPLFELVNTEMEERQRVQ